MGYFLSLESEADMKDGIFFGLIEDEDIWKFFYIKGAFLIARHSSLRAANGISKTGYVYIQTNGGSGVNYNLEEEISPYEDMPEDLKKSQRTWYKGEYKQY